MLPTKSPLHMSEVERETARGEVDQIVGQLKESGATFLPTDVNNVGAFDYIAQFYFGDIKVTVFLSIKDWQVTSDVVITNMTTLPESECSKGYGSQVIACLLSWATTNNFNEIMATQVSNPRSWRFWEKNGFIKIPEPNDCGDWVYVFNG